MGKKATKNFLYYISTVLYFISMVICNPLNSQESKDNYLKVRGLAEDNLHPTEGAIVKLFKDAELVKKITTDYSGEFEFILDLNKNYLIEVSKPGFISKKLAFKTHIPEDEHGVWVNDFAINLVKECQGVDVSVLDQPMDEIKYDLRYRGFKPDKEYNKVMFKKLERIYIELEDCHYDHYISLIDKADGLLKQDKLEEARELYQEAAEHMPHESYPRKKIYDIVQEIQKRHAVEVEYAETINKADGLFSQERYEEAIDLYKSASKLKPDESYPESKIYQARSIQDGNVQQKQLAKKEAMELLEEKENRYDQILAKADELYSQDNYLSAKNTYQEALAMNPDDTYVQLRLNKIDRKIEKKQEDLFEAQQQEKQNQYENLIARADNHFNSGAIDEAKKAYEKALTLFPNESYPSEKVELIREIKNEKILAAQKEKQINEQYTSALKTADHLMELGEFNLALSKYELASTLKPSEAYPQSRISEINNRILRQKEEKEKVLAAQKEKEEEQNRLAREAQYQKITQNAEQLYALGELNLARETYKEALELKPGDQTINNKLKEIDQQIARKERQIQEKKESQLAYENAIEKADKFFALEEYQMARSHYQNALSIKPAEGYPKQKIATITEIVNKQEAQLAQEKLKEQRYHEAISSADKLFKAGKYDQASVLYEVSLNHNPTSTYAKDQLNKIEKLKLIASQQKTTSHSNDKKKIAALKFRNDNERKSYLSKLKRQFPEGITLEIYEEEYKTTKRYIVVRDNEANEFREIRHSWGGVDYYLNDKAISQPYFLQQTKSREGEYFKEFKIK